MTFISNLAQLDMATIIQDTLTHDILRYVVGAGGTFLVINLGLARLLGWQRLQAQGPQAGQFRREILTSLRTVLIFATFGTLITVLAELGLNRITSEMPSQLLFWGSVAAIIVAHDAYFYWTHRLLHHPRFFRRWHRLHHKSHTPTPFTSYSFDWEEAVLNAVFLLVWTVVVPMHPAALFIFVVHMMLRNAIGHCGYEVFPAGRNGRPLFDWLTTVTHHDLHHRNGGFNMGLYFTWWDRLMGTEHPEYRAHFEAAKLRARAKNRLALPSLSVLALAALFAAPAQLDAQPISGTYVSAGMSYVLRFDGCDTRATDNCVAVAKGMDRMARATNVAFMMPPHRGAGWTYMALMTREGQHSGWMRHDKTGTIEVLGCRRSDCTNMRWHRIRKVAPDLGSLSRMSSM